MSKYSLLMMYDIFARLKFVLFICGTVRLRNEDFFKTFYFISPL